MQSPPEQLANALGKATHRCYLVTGDETLLVQESADLIRKHAREQGCSEREVIDASPKDFNWNEIHNSAANMSLFSDRKLIELHLPSGKPGAEGSKALCSYLDNGDAEDILLIIAGKIDKPSTNSKWFKAIDKAGLVVQVWPVDVKKLPRWLEQRVRSAGMTISEDALQLLCDRVEGNLLSAAQEIEKLKLLAPGKNIDIETVTQAVANNARFNLFGMADNAVMGNSANSLRMLYGLRGEGTEPPVPLWALLRELRTLYELKVIGESGGNVQKAMQEKRIWNSKMPMVQSALKRHTQVSLEHALHQAAIVDGSIKGFADGNPWDNLARLILNISAPDVDAHAA